MITLTELANKFGTDKGTISQAAHSYTTIYDLLLSSRRDQALNILEIGLSTGGPELGNPADRTVTDIPSVKMWHEFFPQAKIYGVDISDFSKFREEWFYFIQADCGDEPQLEKAADLGIDFDIIVDDGSHASFHQQLTLLKLSQLLKAVASTSLRIWIGSHHIMNKAFPRPQPLLRSCDLLSKMVRLSARARCLLSVGPVFKKKLVMCYCWTTMNYMA